MLEAKRLQSALMKRSSKISLKPQMRSSDEIMTLKKPSRIDKMQGQAKQKWKKMKMTQKWVKIVVKWLGWAAH